MNLGVFANDDGFGSDPTAEARAWRHAADILVDPADYHAAELTYGPVPARIAAELGLTEYVVTLWRDVHERIHP